MKGQSPSECKEARFLVAELWMIPYDGCEEYQQNGCRRTAAAAATAASVTPWMPLATGVLGIGLFRSQLLKQSPAISYSYHIWEAAFRCRLP